MFLINRLDFDKDKHISTRVIKTFPKEYEKQAREYLENCYMLSSYFPTHEKYELQEI